MIRHATHALSIFYILSRCIRGYCCRWGRHPTIFREIHDWPTNEHVNAEFVEFKMHPNASGSDPCTVLDAPALHPVHKLNLDTRQWAPTAITVIKFSQCFPNNFLFPNFVGAKKAMLIPLNINMPPHHPLDIQISLSLNWWTMRTNCENVQRVWRWITLSECKCEATTRTTRTSNTHLDLYNIMPFIVSNSFYCFFLVLSRRKKINRKK